MHARVHSSSRRGPFQTILIVFGLVLGALGTMSVPASAVQTYSVTSAVSLPNGQKITGFDISFVDPVLGRYFLADRTNKSIDVVNTANNQLIAQFTAGFAGALSATNISGPDGVLVVDHTQIWAGDGNSTVKVLDVNTGNLLQTINTGGTKRADELCYDPDDHIVSIANDADGFITLISTTTYQILAKIKFDGTNGAPNATNGIEQCQYDARTNMFYQNIPEVNGPGDDSAPGAVVLISPKTLRIAQIYAIPIDLCAGPQGMAVGPNNQILLGCALHGSIIVNNKDLHVIATLPTDYAGDEVGFDMANNHYVLAESGHLPAQLGVIDPPLTDTTGTAASNPVPTNTGGGTAHSVAADPVYGQIYVPIASTATGNICSSVGGVDANGCIAIYTSGPSPTTLASAVLPNARTTVVGNPVFAFASVINTGGKVATECPIGLPDGLRADLLFQTTNAQNQVVGTADSPAVSIAPGATQNFVFAITPFEPVNVEIPLRFNCADSAPAFHAAGLNTFLLNASTTPIPDMLSISDTLTHDGNIVISGTKGTGVMATATMNIASATGTVTATASDTPVGQQPRNLPLFLNLCQTNSAGACMAPPSSSVTVANVTPGQVLTFGVFVQGAGVQIGYIPQFNRVFLELTQAGTPVGETSAAVKMQ